MKCFIVGGGRIIMIKYHYKSILVRFFPSWVYAFTFGQHIFVRRGSLHLKQKRHEEKHCDQYRKHGICRFLWIYFWEERHLSYIEKTFEIEAKAAEDKITNR